jgi:hypothetical protein
MCSRVRLAYLKIIAQNRLCVIIGGTSACFAGLSLSLRNGDGNILHSVVYKPRLGHLDTLTTMFGRRRSLIRKCSSECGDMSKGIRVLVIDDHALFREGLDRLLPAST